ncbi:Y-family DNA polymerase [Leptothrix discophora]|uniref:DNA polymerase Y family protein n=1 Tax=Leptothrix discophora TaxID=89 RepID=A0ABT9G129_LEPDI|nr:DNA polymerase Y family protein [Leptothrix discophora]MDP4300101.1 DNA polymerase Y family protein [Leptothrix discophora]
MPAPLPALWLCLHLPQLSLDALGPWPPGVVLPALVWQGDGARGRLVHQANAAAQALGVRAGLRLGSAQGLAPQTLVLARDAMREAALLERLALTLGQLSSHVVVDPPVLLVDLHASLRLFGGLRALLRRADALVAACGLPQRTWGLAATPLAARLLAQSPASAWPGAPHRRCATLARTRRLIAPLPLGQLAEQGVPAEHRADGGTDAMLMALGLRRIDELRRLPRAGLRRRGAGPWLDALDRAWGDRPDPRVLHEPPETFSLRLELAGRADGVAPIEAAAEPLLQALCGWLHRRWQAAQGLRLSLHHEYSQRRHLPDLTLDLDLARPSRDPVHLRTLLREHLQRLELAAPVDAVGLSLLRSVPEHGQPVALWPDARTQALAHGSLIDRLQARLGRGRVRRLQLQADARPEKADRWVDADQPATPAAPGEPAPARPSDPPRPTWLLPEPELLAEQHDRPLHQGRPLRLLTRAERIETGWHDGALVRRDYHVALAADGRLCWIYREPGARWYLHGLFA